MSDIPGTTRAQTKFLRAMSKNPSGPPPELWPSPSALRRWLRRPGFLKALQSVREALFFQADIHLAYTANSAFQALKHALANLPSDPDLRKLQNATIHAASRLARISHLRQQNPADPPVNHSADNPFAYFRSLHPMVPVGQAVLMYDQFLKDHKRPPTPSDKLVDTLFRHLPIPDPYILQKQQQEEKQPS